MAKRKNLSEAIEEQVEEVTEIKEEKLDKPFYRVKDANGEKYDFKTINEVAEALEFNSGFVKKLIRTGAIYLGIKIYIVK